MRLMDDIFRQKDEKNAVKMVISVRALITRGRGKMEAVRIVRREWDVKSDSQLERLFQERLRAAGIR
jgi:hypothetical protein